MMGLRVDGRRVTPVAGGSWLPVARLIIIAAAAAAGLRLAGARVTFKFLLVIPGRLTQIGVTLTDSSSGWPTSYYLGTASQREAASPPQHCEDGSPEVARQDAPRRQCQGVPSHFHDSVPPKRCGAELACSRRCVSITSGPLARGVESGREASEESHAADDPLRTARFSHKRNVIEAAPSGALVGHEEVQAPPAVSGRKGVDGARCA